MKSVRKKQAKTWWMLEWEQTVELSDNTHPGGVHLAEDFYWGPPPQLVAMLHSEYDYVPSRQCHIRSLGLECHRCFATRTGFLATFHNGASTNT